MGRLRASARPMIVSDLGHTMDPFAVIVYPSGVEKSLHERIHKLKGWCGDKQGKKFRAWMEGESSIQIGSSAWLLNFDK